MSINGELDRAAETFVGVDIGGTHTDVSVFCDGRVERGKALTTHDDVSRGVLEAVEVAAGNLGRSREELPAGTRLLINGTSFVTNAITELRGSRVGALVTKGFRDAFRIAGGPRGPALDDHLQANVPDLMDRRAIVEIEERIDWCGDVIVPIDLDQVRAAARHLVKGLGIEAIAICFLWSHANSEHELAAEIAVKEVHPDLFVSTSHGVFPVQGETRRWTTTVLSSFVQDRVDQYLTALSANLRDAGLGGGLTFFQGMGGGISLEKARRNPLALLGSGQAGGAIGATALARELGFERVLMGDMGGTSFDTGIVAASEIQVDKAIQVGPFKIGVNMVDVVSVGAGGGSIAWVSERGVPQVGPLSAGSAPGPAVLGRGGVEPTVTDALVVMGLIHPDRYLGGRVRLQPELAREALDSVFGDRFGWSPEDAAAAIHDLLVADMANAVRNVAVSRGHDPKDLLFLACGGTLPLFAAQIAERLGMATIVIPRNSSVFSALGVLDSNFALRSDQGVGWDLSKPDGVDRVNEIGERMVAKAFEEMLAEDFAPEDISIHRSADIRFQGQVNELTLPLPDRPLSREDAHSLFDRFVKRYEQTYGKGTAWKDVAASLVKLSVVALGRQPRPEPALVDLDPRPPEDLERGRRPVFLPGERLVEDVPVYDDAIFSAGSTIAGPAPVDAGDTTIYAPPATTIERDRHLNYVMNR